METVTALLTELASRGVKLSAEGGQLNCYAPPGTLTDDIRSGILRHRSEILSLLKGRDKGLYRRPADDRPREFPLSAGEKGLYIL